MAMESAQAGPTPYVGKPEACWQPHSSQLLIKQHLGYTLDSTVLSYQSDNLELIKQQQNHLSYTYSYPNAMLTTEFDLTKMIHML